ncbi:MAG: hypothetical protein FWG66_03495, partial [Spirochaetes bacterium]|nr:hypothetical protein [Spirochaetota bacterium]
MQDELLRLQKEIYDCETADFEGEKQEYLAGHSAALYFFPAGGLFDISFYGVGYDQNPDVKAKDQGYDYNFPFCALLDLLCEPANAEKLVSLRFDGADEGANGINGWDFTRLVESGVSFPNLKSFEVKLTEAGDHNMSIIDSGGSMAEDGMVAKLLEKMPALETLAVPSAPDESFFAIGKHPLVKLTVQAGDNPQDFIENLAGADNFFQLRAFDFADLPDIVTMGDPALLVPFEAYEKLFGSKVLR